MSGRVTDFDGQPILSAPVVVFGHPATAPDGDGRFSVAGVSVPYDLAVLGGMGNRYAVVYQGLRRADPTVLQEPAVPGAPAPARSATLTGEITPYSSGEVVVAFGSPQTRAAPSAV